ncbi:hypothetical protein [Dyadobacter tibetensis]|uniref:hypothetical protein n=1 Tax=Dyadobacter tibetensis TaxID=1211851 RepID=UPI000470DC51|nr:hypothetical protein [Dyadobacter tibetensis]
MKYLQLLERWTRQSIQDAKLMILLGSLAAGATFISWVWPSAFSDGLSLPLGLLALFLLFYGGFTLKNRPKIGGALSKAFHESPKAALNAEKRRVLQHRNSQYKVLGSWGLIIIAGFTGYLLALSEYLQGLAVGFIVLGAILLMSDLWSLKRLKSYAESLESLQ